MSGAQQRPAGSGRVIPGRVTEAQSRRKGCGQNPRSPDCVPHPAPEAACDVGAPGLRAPAAACLGPSHPWSFTHPPSIPSVPSPTLVPFICALPGSHHPTGWGPEDSHGHLSRDGWDEEWQACYTHRSVTQGGWPGSQLQTWAADSLQHVGTGPCPGPEPRLTSVLSRDSVGVSCLQSFSHHCLRPAR